MKFDQLYSKLLREMDVASVYGDVAADGDLETGWTASDNIYGAMAVFGGKDQDEVKKKKKKKNKKTKPNIQRRPKIGTM